MNKLVYILRGLPGSSRNIFFADLASDASAVLIEAEVDSYKEKKLYDEAHKIAFKEFCEAVKAEKPKIIVNNTNIKIYHFFPYVDYARRHGYEVLVCVAPVDDMSERELSRKANVPEMSIRTLLDAFEWKVRRPRKPKNLLNKEKQEKREENK